MDNFFDQFDAPATPEAPAATGNFFDQFDQAPATPNGMAVGAMPAYDESRVVAPPVSQGEKFKMGLQDVQKGFGQAMLHAGGMSEPYEGIGDIQDRMESAQEAAPRYDAGIEKRETDWQTRRTASGDNGIEWMRMVGNIAGTAPLMAAFTPGSAPASLATAMVRGAGLGATSAGLNPVTSGEYATGKLKQQTLGAAFGGPLSGFGYGVGKAITKGGQLFAPSAEPLTQEALRATSKASYKAAEDAGVVIKNEAFGDFVNGLPKQLEGYRPRVAPKAGDVIETFREEVASGNPITLETLDELRQVASGAAKTNDRNEVRLISSIVEKLDDFIDDLGGEKIVAGDAEKGVAALNRARSEYRTFAKLRNINDIVEIGENLNDPNWTKNQFRAIIRKPKVFNQYSADEKDLIKSVAETGNLERIAKVIPWRGAQTAAPFMTQIGQDKELRALQNLVASGGNNFDAPGGKLPALLGGNVRRAAPLLGGFTGGTAPVILGY